MPFPFQEEVWQAYLGGESGLIHAATGTGKTYAAWLGPVPRNDSEIIRRGRGAEPRDRRRAHPSLLWVTPLASAGGRHQAALLAPVEDLGLPWTVESRTGDTAPRSSPPAQRLPTALVTTPESLSLLLTREMPRRCSSTSSWWWWTNGMS